MESDHLLSLLFLHIQLCSVILSGPGRDLPRPPAAGGLLPQPHAAGHWVLHTRRQVSPFQGYASLPLLCVMPQFILFSYVFLMLSDLSVLFVYVAAFQLVLLFQKSKLCSCVFEVIVCLNTVGNTY